MSARKHCKFLRMVTVRMSRDERAKISKAAAAAKLPINTWCRRQLGLPDHAVEDSETAKRVYLVMAGNRREAENWARRRGMPSVPGYASGWIYGSSPMSIQGSKGLFTVFTGTFNQREDAKEIYRLVAELTSRGLLLPESNWVRDKFEAKE
jgi:hypothetical protein